MSLDGLRAWIGEVERKLGMRTRVFLVLAVIAIGGAGAAVYLAIDARDSAVSEGDVQALQQELEARIDEGGGSSTAAASVAQLEAELEELRTQVEGLSGEGSGKQGKSEGGGKKGTSEGTSDGGLGSSGGATSEGPGVGATGGGPSAAKLQELLEKTKEESEKNE